MATASARYRIAEIAERTGFSTATLRYYEQIGLLPSAERSHNGYRLYDDRAIERLRFVDRAKQLGCTLEETKDLVEAWEDDRCGPVQHRLGGLVGGKLSKTQRRIAELVALAGELRRVAGSLAAQPVDGPCDRGCACMTSPDAPERQPVPLIEKRQAPEEAAIACTLAPVDVPGRVAEWQTVLALVTGRSVTEGGLHLLFGSAAPIEDIVRLAAAEHDCCGFFGFAVTIDHRGVGLDVTAPADALPLMFAVFGEAA